MVIQTEVTLQADHVLSACDGGEIPHCRNCYLINLPAYPSSTIVNTSCVNFLSTRCLVVTAHYNARRFPCLPLGLLVTIKPIVSVGFAVVRSKFCQRQYFLTQFTVLLLLQMLFLTYSLTTT